VNAEIITEMIKFFNITAVTQNANITVKKIAFKAIKIYIIYMHYLLIVETNINFKRQQMS